MKSPYWLIVLLFELVSQASAAHDGERGPIVRGTTTVLDDRLDVPEHLLAVSYNQGQDFIYIFGGLESNRIYQLDLWTQEITTVGQTAIGAGSVASNDDDVILYFGGFSGTLRGQIMQWNSSNPGDLIEQVALLPNAYRYTSVVWNTAADEAYIFGGESEPGQDRFGTIVKYELGSTEATIVASMRRRSRTAAVWDHRMNVAYVFAGEVSFLVRSAEIVKFDPAGGDAIVLEETLPAALEWPCAVWTGEEALIIGGIGAVFPEAGRVVSRNITRFVPGSGEESGSVTEIEVANLPSLYAAGCAYVRETDRIYLFGGFVGGQASDRVIYIQLERETLPTTTEGTTPRPEPPTPSLSPHPPTTTTSTTIDPTNPAICTAIDKYGIRYEASAGSTARENCPGFQSTGTVTWFCTALGMFDGPQPNYRNCTNGWLPGLVDEVPPEGAPIDYATAATLLQILHQHVVWAANYEGNGTYFGHEIGAIFHVGQRILEVASLNQDIYLEQREELTGMNLKVYSEVLAFVSPWEEMAGSEKAETATAFISSTDISLITLARFSQQGYRKPFTNNTEFIVLAGAEAAADQNRITFPHVHNPNRYSHMEIPATWVNGFDPGAVVPFSGVQLLPTRANFLFMPSVPEGIAGTILNGPLMSFTFGHFNNSDGSPKLNFTAGPGVRITFQHDIWAWGDKPTKIRRKLHSDQGERPKAVSGSAICAFWDPIAHVWSGFGCALVSSGRDTSICECNHLTSFGVIMDLHDYVGQDTVLTIITLILCPLSTLGLLLYILIFLYHRRTQRLMSNHPRNELTFGLCISLFVANLLILVTMDKTYLYLSDEMCIASAITLHYALLCAFAWMALEGLLLARLILVDVFSSGREHQTIERLAAFLVPAVIVGVTCVLNFSRGDNGYGNDSYCLLNGDYLWGFIGPVIVVVIFNTVVLSLSIRRSHMLKFQSNLKVQRKASTIGVFLQGSLNLTAIMGLTWAFGFLMFFDNSEIAHFAAYAFTLFNASQGIFIFAFHVAANEQIQRKFSIFSTKSTTTLALVAEFGGSESRTKSGKDVHSTK